MTKDQFIILLAAFFSVLVAARADLVMQNQNIIFGETNTLTTKIHGDKIRDDSTGDEDLPIIKDASTGDMFILMPQKKEFSKYSGAKQKEWIKNRKKQSSTQPKLLDTGKSENVGGYDAEIYSWSDNNGMTVMYWVAKDYPDYQSLKIYLAKYDEANLAGLGNDSPIQISKLPGMLVKSQSVTKDFKHTRTLISVKEEPIDSSIFEIPKDYREIDTTENTQPTKSSVIVK
jgi:hypothetical protein